MITGYSQPFYFNNVYNPINTWATGLSVEYKDNGYLACAVSGNIYNFYNICLLNIQEDGTMGNYLSYGQNGMDYYPGENGSFKKDGDNGYYLYGSIDYFNYTVKGLFMYFDTNGDSIFSKKFESYYTTRLAGRNCVKTKDNGYILTGDENVLDSAGVDFYIIKIDSIGNEKWRQHHGMNNNGDVPYSIIQTPDSGFAIGGLTFTGVQITYDPLIIKTDSLGNLEWMLNLGGEYMDDKAMVCNTHDSCIIVLTAIGDSMDTPYHAYARINLVKIDLNGNVIWNKKYGTSRIVNYISNISSSNNDGFILCGHVMVNGNLEMAGWIMEVDANGDSLLYREYYYYPESSLDPFNYLYDISLASDNGFVATGQAYTLDPPYNVQKMWVLKVDSVGCEIPNCWVGIEEQGGGEAGEQGSVDVWPNPTSNIVNCRFSIYDFRGDWSLEIYDIYGRPVNATILSSSLEGGWTVDVSKLFQGIYFVSVLEDGQRIATGKFVVAR
jgi:hypothetical protein